MRLKLSLLALVIFLGPTLTWAATQSRIVKLIVTKPLAPVYAEPNFDAKIIYQLKSKQAVYGTRKLLEGQGGLGFFHKVRLKKGVHGYVLDTDVHVLGSPVKTKKTSSRKKRKPKVAGGYKETEMGFLIKEPPKKESKLQDTFQVSQSVFNAQKLPFFFRRYAGVNLGVINYAEKIATGKKSSTEWAIGAKLTGPNWVFRDFMVDVNINFHFGAPAFFDDFATEASGFLLQADLTLPFELKPLTNGSFYGGIGPLVSASMFEFVYLGNEESTKKIRLGAVLMLGVGYDIGGYALKLEPKFYFENTSYFAFLAGIQKRF